MKKLLALLAVVAGIFLTSAPSAYAHVLVTDKATDSSAILHISPNDDPIAGKDTELYFDIHTDTDKSKYNQYALYVTNDNNQTQQVPVEAVAEGLSAHYVFPAQALYELQLKNPNSPKDSINFKYSLRVSRGTVGSATNTPKYAWTEPAIITILITLLLLVILFINNRTEIFKRSSFK